MARKKKRHVITGTVTKHRRGYGFVISDEMDEDIFIAASSMKGAMDGDTAEVELIPDYLWRQSPEGIIVRIISRNTTEVAGTFARNGKFGTVRPESRKHREDILVRKKDFSGAKTGDKVVVTITRYPDRYGKAEGRISEIISRAGQPGGDIKALARSYGMRETFPSRAAAEAKAVGKRKISDEDIRCRRDLRDRSVFTIDGADSKDFDDAVSIEIKENGNYILGVHIADVSHFVKEGGALDQEALKRGTSVYLLDQVIPMLPKVLSNGICSLNPDEDRLAVTVDMELTEDGALVSHEIYESIIRSRERLIYDDVSDILENGDRELSKRYEDIKDELEAMGRLAAVLRRKRKERGSLDFDLDEARITLDEKGIPTEVETASRRTANRLIEEFMLLANETVAEHFYWMEVPFIYRVHEKPDLKKAWQLRVFLRNFGIALKGSPENIHPGTISDILESVKGRPDENIVNSVTLRSMQKAFYSTSCEGHFGLALKYYCHFTSPIRRYPDLMIHRIIKRTIKGEMTGKAARYFRKAASEAAELSSAAERKAIEAEREAEKLKKTEYMTYHIGESARGIISGVTGFGIYVQLENTIEGLIRIEDLDDDYYDHDADSYCLRGRHSGKVYRLGDAMEIIVADADTDRREISFLPADRQQDL